MAEHIDAFHKLKFESDFQRLSPGGAISYIEVPNMQNNIPAVIAVMKYIYENIMYAELNTKSDYCMQCGYDGEIKIIDDETANSSGNARTAATTTSTPCLWQEGHADTSAPSSGTRAAHRKSKTESSTFNHHY